MRQFASHTDTIAEGFHSMVGTSSASSVVAAPHQRSRKTHISDTNSVATSTAHTRRQDDPGATWALARRLVREYTPIVVVLQCFFRKTLARMMLTRLRYEKKTRDVYLQAWKYNSKRLRMFREQCTNKGRDAFMTALRRSQERREQERRRREELARQHRLLREKSATLIQSMWRMFTTQQDFLEARDKHAQFREEANTAEFIVNGIVGIQRLVRHFLWMCKWSRVMRIREYYSARMIQMKWRKVLRRREELEAMYRHAHRVAEAAFKIQVWYRALSASKKFREEYDSDDDE
ncbi:IQ calmodulin-binding protein, putative [Bodo saltans]|uniref:IQ calmodulin-binding protein, putative n=1 Tax=Bodo saltans TaxID=75058 RepID=A0A0S4J1R4_BODSA|nr:IQ calmodulin-binding protein, putative [Bodo saltans]|eukprot:CUG82007.1 IQ calmodulin-binding protein, putative [Bodo saltans]